MSAAILMRQKFGSETPAANAPVIAEAPDIVDMPPPVRRHTPLVERYRTEITEFFRAVIPMVFGLALFVAVWVPGGPARPFPRSCAPPSIRSTKPNVGTPPGFCGSQPPSKKRVASRFLPMKQPAKLF